VTAPDAPVSAEADLQHRGSPPERLVRQPPDHRVPGRALASAVTTPSVGLDNPAPENRPIGLQPLPEHFEPEIIKTSERGQVRAGEGSVRHVEVFQMDGKSPPSSGDFDPCPATDAPTGLHPQLRLRRAQIAPVRGSARLLRSGHD